MEKEMSESPEEPPADSPNKSQIGRELKNLIQSTKESKMLTEFAQIKSKKRKSRRDSSLSNKKEKVDIEKRLIQRKKSNSCHRMDTETRARSDFKDFENLFQNQNKSKPFKRGSSCPLPNTSSKKSTISIIKMDKNGRTVDPFCWKCHKIGTKITCSRCPKTFHLKCLLNKPPDESTSVCFECINIINSEDGDKKSKKMAKLSIADLAELLNFTLNRILGIPGIEPFMDFVDTEEFPEYMEYIIQPMCLNQLRQNVANHYYKCTAAFVVDCKLIWHNSAVFNTVHSKLTSLAKSITRVCNEETKEIEICPECYKNANIFFSTWFTEVCSPPHILLWAKLKSFPYWPSKAMAVSNGMVDVRFFGAHDKAWVPVKDCFLYSLQNPNGSMKTKQEEIRKSIIELNTHVKNIKSKFFKFVPAVFKTKYDPSNNDQHTKMFPAFSSPKSPALEKKSTQSTPSPTTKIKKNILNELNNSKMQPKVVLDMNIRNMIAKSNIQIESGEQPPKDLIEIIENIKTEYPMKRKSLTPTKWEFKPTEKRKRLSDSEIQTPNQTIKKLPKISDSDVTNDSNNSEIMLEYMAALKMCRSNANNPKRLSRKSKSPTGSDNTNKLDNDDNLVDIKPDISQLSDKEGEKPDIISFISDPIAEDFTSKNVYPDDEDNKYFPELLEEKFLSDVDDNIDIVEEKNFLNNLNENQFPKENSKSDENEDIQNEVIIKKENPMPTILDAQSEYVNVECDNLEPLITFSKNNTINTNKSSDIPSPSKLILKVAPVSRSKPSVSSMKSLLAENLSDSVPTPVLTETDKLPTPDVSFPPEMNSTSKLNPDIDLLPEEELLPAPSLSLSPNPLPRIGQVVSLRNDKLSNDEAEDTDSSDSLIIEDSISKSLSDDDPEWSPIKKIANSNQITVKKVKSAPHYKEGRQFNNNTLGCSDKVSNLFTKSKEVIHDLLEENSAKLMADFKNMFLNMVKSHDGTVNTDSTVLSLKLEIEALKIAHKRNFEEIFHNYAVEQIERMHSMDMDKESLKKNMKWQFNRRVEYFKFNQWCAYCKFEAKYQCCWVTWYCSTSCQKLDWKSHCLSCCHVLLNNKTRSNSKNFETISMPKLSSDPRIIPASASATASTSASASTSAPKQLAQSDDDHESTINVFSDSDVDE